ncbi:hypothetical protein CLIB1444_01S07932 [[Candida] jaroonii]|uniref:Uncharacterized protein n=1 Tax=[Candida] jaroonii TaxID=467808 RepID=A0ACA9Y0Y6_9ASCO|nr:hypothetical protein CLIB1444_01S07932 [[Candida] jaroonii]
MSDKEVVQGSVSIEQNEAKKSKQRKGQTDEEYEIQKQIFHENGPLVNDQDWLLDEDDLANLDKDNKYDRTRIIFACEKLYFERKFDKCLELIQFGEKFYDTEIPTDNGKTKKSSSIDRQVMELSHIKEKCLSKLKGGN